MQDDLGNRMKCYYEDRSRHYLLRKIPVIIRVDGKSFSHFCRRFKKPYDLEFNGIMNTVMRYLCEEIQGTKFAQRHSDEISLVLTDLDGIKTEGYFDYNIQKISSVVASLATSQFCKSLHMNNLISYEETWPTFDCRCFNMPIDEISNYCWWRLLDAKRSSINMLAQSLFSHKELQGKSCNEMQEMIYSTHGLNWDSLTQGQKVGFQCRREQVEKVIEKGPKAGEKVLRSVWSLYESPKTLEELRETVRAFTDRSI